MATPIDPETRAQILSSLQSGRGVRLQSGQPALAQLDDSTPIDAAGEQFLDGKMAKIEELLDRGFIVNLDSQGNILARTPDSRSRYVSTQETEIDVMDRLMVKSAIDQGFDVTFEPDGSLVIDGDGDRHVPSPAQAAERWARFEAAADSGQIAASMARGETYVDAGPALDEAFDTAAELEAEANAIELGSLAAYDDRMADYRQQIVDANVAVRSAESELAEVKARLQTYETARDAAAKTLETARRDHADALQRASEARSEGRDLDALQAEASATKFETYVAIAEADLSAATAKATEVRESVAGSETALQNLRSERDTIQDHILLDDVDTDLEQVTKARAAAAELREAERLEAALVDLEARGVPGTDRVRAAIAQHRAAAEQLVQDAGLQSPPAATTPTTDATGGTGTADSETDDTETGGTGTDDTGTEDSGTEGTGTEGTGTDGTGTDDTETEATQPEDTETEATQQKDIETEATQPEDTQEPGTGLPEEFELEAMVMPPAPSGRELPIGLDGPDRDPTTPAPDAEQPIRPGDASDSIDTEDSPRGGFEPDGIDFPDPGFDPGSDPGLDPGLDPGFELGPDPGFDPGLDDLSGGGTFVAGADDLESGDTGGFDATFES